MEVEEHLLMRSFPSFEDAFTDGNQLCNVPQHWDGTGVKNAESWSMLLDLQKQVRGSVKAIWLLPSSIAKTELQDRSKTLDISQRLDGKRRPIWSEFAEPRSYYLDNVWFAWFSQRDQHTFWGLTHRPLTLCHNLNAL
jgi:hypothetical protein